MVYFYFTKVGSKLSFMCQTNDNIVLNLCNQKVEFLERTYHQDDDRTIGRREMINDTLNHCDILRWR